MICQLRMRSAWLMFGLVSLSALVQDAKAQTTHTLKPAPKTVAWGNYAALVKPEDMTHA